jgi:membrane fusion protein, heavy metal efflux system
MFRSNAIALFSITMSAAACTKKAPPAPAPAATLHPRLQEGDLQRITLTAQAEARLGITVASAEERVVPRVRSVGGEVFPSSGRSLSIVAPVAGRLDRSTLALHAGQMVKRGDALISLTPVATVDRDVRATAERGTVTAEARYTAMEARLARAEKLLADGAGSARAAEEARVDRDTAKAELDAAKARSGMIAQSPLAADVSVTLRAPEDAVIRTMSAAPGAIVPAGALLFDLVGTGALWVRTSVFVGDVPLLKTGASARVRQLTAAPSEADSDALPANGPPTADPATSTYDLYFTLPTEARFRPGERVALDLLFRSEEQAVCIAPSAIVRDVSGSAWVYLAVAEHTFERRRVELERVEPGCARIGRGLSKGASVVTTGATELFGFEFGGGK